MMNTMKGKVVDTKGGPNPHGFWIEGEDGVLYYSHLGDLLKNEEKLYKNSTQATVYLRKGDIVTFKPFKSNCNQAISVNNSQ